MNVYELNLFLNDFQKLFVISEDFIFSRCAGENLNL